MFEKRLIEISNRLDKMGLKEYYLLTHKKHKREIYFQNNKKAISFIKNRFDSAKKKIIYSLIKIGILQLFLKKIYLSSELGDVIFVAEQIKSFDLNKKIVFSFIKEEKDRGLFLKSKRFQKEVAKKSFAPKIMKLDEQVPFSEEELLEQYNRRDYLNPFRKLYSFYEKKGIEEISSKKYINYLIKEMKKNKMKNKFISSILKKLISVKDRLLITTVHGDFAKEQILLKDGSYVFTDWDPQKGLIIQDLVNFYMTSEILEKRAMEKNEKFKELLKLYPKEVQKNLILYLILNEMFLIVRGKGNFLLSKKRLKRFLTSSSSFF